MTREAIVRFFDERQSDWRTRDPDLLAARHAVDGTVVSPMFGALHGRVEIAESYRRLFATFPDWYFKNEELVIDGNRVAQHFVSTATHVGEFMGLPGTNRHGRIEGVLLFTMKDGQILHEQRLYDFSVLRSKPNF